MAPAIEALRAALKEWEGTVVVPPLAAYLHHLVQLNVLINAARDVVKAYTDEAKPRVNTARLVRPGATHAEVCFHNFPLGTAFCTECPTAEYEPDGCSLSK